MNHVPAYIDMADIAKACPLDYSSTVAAKRDMQREGIAVKRGGRWKVSDAMLRERLPDVYDRVYSWFEQTIRNDPSRSETIRNDHP